MEVLNPFFPSGSWEALQRHRKPANLQIQHIALLRIKSFITKLWCPMSWSPTSPSLCLFISFYPFVLMLVLLQNSPPINCDLPPAGLTVPLSSNFCWMQPRCRCLQHHLNSAVGDQRQKLRLSMAKTDNSWRKCWYSYQMSWVDLSLEKRKQTHK